MRTANNIVNHSASAIKANANAPHIIYRNSRMSKDLPRALITFSPKSP